ncbi:hypothetical protein HK104_002791 [Borealophlyctis nickersoniae]|nr:hypothetical protein HK104_002791 [Borealophlyctis nickersoniae]
MAAKSDKWTMLEDLLLKDARGKYDNWKEVKKHIGSSKTVPEIRDRARELNMTILRTEEESVYPPVQSPTTKRRVSATTKALLDQQKAAANQHPNRPAIPGKPVSEVLKQLRENYAQKYVPQKIDLPSGETHVRDRVRDVEGRLEAEATARPIAPIGSLTPSRKAAVAARRMAAARSVFERPPSYQAATTTAQPEENGMASSNQPAPDEASNEETASEVPSLAVTPSHSDDGSTVSADAVAEKLSSAAEDKSSTVDDVRDAESEKSPSPEAPAPVSTPRTPAKRLRFEAQNGTEQLRTPTRSSSRIAARAKASETPRQEVSNTPSKPDYPRTNRDASEDAHDRTSTTVVVKSTSTLSTSTVSVEAAATPPRAAPVVGKRKHFVATPKATPMATPKADRRKRRRVADDSESDEDDMEMDEVQGRRGHPLAQEAENWEDEDSEEDSDYVPHGEPDVSEDESSEEEGEEEGDEGLIVADDDDTEEEDEDVEGDEEEDEEIDELEQDEAFVDDDDVEDPQPGEEGWLSAVLRRTARSLGIVI